MPYSFFVAADHYDMPLIIYLLVKESQNQAAPRTMDALFAQMKAQRMRTVPQQQANPAPGRHFNQQRLQQQQRRGRGYGGRNVGNQ